jgi:hypothetical protein
VLVLATLGAEERRRRIARRKRRQAAPEPEPTPVVTGRATIIDVGDPLADDEQARSWLRGAGEDELQASLDVLIRALHAYRLVSADPHIHEIARGQVLVARVGYGAGEQVADGLWTQANEILHLTRRQRRAAALEPQARLAAVLNGRERVLAVQELTLRARLDLTQGRYRESALQVMVALDAALAELAVDDVAPALAKRLSELRGLRDGVAEAAQEALAGPLDDAHREAVTFALRRIEAVLRARAVELA